MTASMRILFALLCFFIASMTHAQLGGKTVFNSLNIYGSARVAALGGNVIAIKDGDINVVAANPALLDSAVSGKFALSYVDYYAKTGMGYAAYAWAPKKSRWTFASTFQYINYGEQDRLDALGNNIGQFSAGDYNLILAAGYQVDSLWSVGANLKTIYSTLDSYYSVANAIDIGATYHKPSKKLTVSAVVRNIGYQWRAYSTGARDKLPLELQIGLTKQPRHAPFRFSVIAGNLQQWDLSYTNPNATVTTDPTTGQTTVVKTKFPMADNLMRHMIFGTEILLHKGFQLRLGYNYLRRQELKLANRPAFAGFSLGLGIQVRKIHLSYGRAIYHASGPANHLTISTDLSQWF
jgi:hypothetical protein